ncbi:hypothetical protein SCHPADRAFT_510397 [Schizopora paradoxa]|uniref:Peptidase S33 tripeptidyl aminopeptidase-like C-terminal domain-containing protein n=1 Tax=Schizopora paradoxa TaxID=27342 RepID=A0A0H2RFL2_9AGAM|nr:hypothetical protein SCHPADRAFT_510397 [Schizopora paradoxa]
MRKEKETLEELGQPSTGRRRSQINILGALLSIVFCAFVVFKAGDRLSLNLLNFDSIPRGTIGRVEWHKCNYPTETGVDCGTIIVPLDYFNYTKGISIIALGRYKATAKKRGTVFLNPGGPGGSGVSLATITGKFFAEIIGPHYDIVGFDPRGIGETLPKVQCFPHPIDQHIFRANTVFEQGFSVSSNLSDPRTREHLIEQQRQFLAMKKTQAELCGQRMSEALPYMGTATVVRDLFLMTSMLDDHHALINYWGGSYGTILGAYLVNMVPDRIGKVAIDGVANPVLWADKPSHYWHREWISSIEDTFRWFLRSCSEAGPGVCPLAKEKNEDPNAIDERILKFLDLLYENPLPVPNARRPGYLTSGGARGDRIYAIGVATKIDELFIVIALIMIYMENPRAWPRLSQILASAMAGDGTAMLNNLLPVYGASGPDLSFAEDLARLAVTCLDSPPPEDESEFPTPELLADIGLETIRDVSKHFGMSTTISEPDGGCQFWPVRGPERFTGPWNHTLSNPILIVSNTADPVTPIASGRLVNKLLHNSSRLLIQNSPGHGSMALSSLCSIKAIRAYYDDGILPQNEFVCESEEQPFDINRSYISTLSETDRRLLEAAEKISEALAESRLRPWLAYTD